MAKKNGIVCETWKTPYFEKALVAAGFEHTPAEGHLLGGVVASIMYVYSDDTAGLTVAVEAAQAAARKSRLN